MDWIHIIAAAGTILVSFITLLGSIYGMMKFLLKDITKDLSVLEKEQKEFREYMKISNEKFDKINARMDGVYHLMLDGKYDLARKKLHEN